MRFEELLDRHERGHLTQGEAGEMLGVSERTFRRWQARYGEEGAAGLRDRRLGKPSPRRAAEDELARARALYAEMYDGFTVKHFHEKLVERRGYRLGYTVTRQALQASGQVKRAPRPRTAAVCLAPSNNLDPRARFARLRCRGSSAWRRARGTCRGRDPRGPDRCPPRTSSTGISSSARRPGSGTRGSEPRSVEPGIGPIPKRRSRVAAT
jgi:transposase